MSDEIVTDPTRLAKLARKAIEGVAERARKVVVMKPWTKLDRGDYEAVVEIDGIRLRLLELDGYEYARPLLVQATKGGLTAGRRYLQHELSKGAARGLDARIAQFIVEAKRRGAADEVAT